MDNNSKPKFDWRYELWPMFCSLMLLFSYSLVSGYAQNVFWQVMGIVFGFMALQILWSIYLWWHEKKVKKANKVGKPSGD